MLGIGITIDRCRKGSSVLPSFPITALIAEAAASIRLITRWVVNQEFSCSARGASEIIVFIDLYSSVGLRVRPARGFAGLLSSTCPDHGPHFIASGVTRCGGAAPHSRSRREQDRVGLAQAEREVVLAAPRFLVRAHAALELEAVRFRLRIVGIGHEEEIAVEVGPQPERAVPADLAAGAAQQREVERRR